MLYPETTNYNTFRDDFAGQFKRMSKAKRPTFVLRKGKAAAVVLSPKEFEAYAAARERDETHRAISESMRQFDAGLGIPWETAKKQLRKRMAAGSRVKPQRKG